MKDVIVDIWEANDVSPATIWVHLLDKVSKAKNRKEGDWEEQTHQAEASSWELEEGG